MILSNDQIEFYNNEGYVLVEDVISEEQLRAMLKIVNGFLLPIKRNKIGMIILQTNAMKRWACLHSPSKRKPFIKKGQIAPHKCWPLATKETASPFLL